MIDPRRLDVARSLAQRFASYPEVEAVALGGSSSTGMADDASDIDLYVYLGRELPLAARQDVAAEQADATSAEVGNEFFEPGDEWTHAASGVAVDLMYRRTSWIEDRIARVLDRHQASLGYTTCLCHNVATSALLYDRRGWLSGQQARANGPYPEPLRRAILAKNLPLLAGTRASYTHQIVGALARGDRVAVNHRLAAFLASYFDGLFAANRRLHPGEKRLLTHAEAPGMRAPSGMAPMIERLFAAAEEGATPEVAGLARRLSDDLARLASDLA
jgi:hypothetical protein